MEDLYQAVLKRKEYLESQPQTDETKFRLREINLFIIEITNRLMKDFIIKE